MRIYAFVFIGVSFFMKYTGSENLWIATALIIASIFIAGSLIVEELKGGKNDD